MLHIAGHLFLRADFFLLFRFHEKATSCIGYFGAILHVGFDLQMDDIWDGIVCCLGFDRPRRMYISLGSLLWESPETLNVLETVTAMQCFCTRYSIVSIVIVYLNEQLNLNAVEYSHLKSRKQ